MNTFYLRIIIPSGIYLKQEAEELYLKSSKGYISILPGHCSYISDIEKAEGFIKVNNKKKYYLFFNGILNIILNKEVTLFIENIEKINKQN